MWISSNSLGGRTALVTGAGRGLGRAIVLNLAQDGAQVALLARSGDELDQTPKQMREYGAGVLAIQADVGDPGQLSAGAGSSASPAASPPTAPAWRPLTWRER